MGKFVKEKRRFVIDWTLSGTTEILAATAEEAQAAFDQMFDNGVPRFVHDGEVSNSRPEPTDFK